MSFNCVSIVSSYFDEPIMLSTYAVANVFCLTLVVFCCLFPLTLGVFIVSASVKQLNCCFIEAEKMAD